MSACLCALFETSLELVGGVLMMKAGTSSASLASGEVYTACFWTAYAAPLC